VNLYELMLQSKKLLPLGRKEKKANGF